jgi:uncharacterized protein (DUF736 family)
MICLMIERIDDRIISIIKWRMTMSNIGYVKKNDKGIFVGRIDTAALSLVIALRPVQGSNPRLPKYSVMTKNPSGQWPEIGALWAQTMTETGEEFLQGKISDPSFETLYFAAFAQNDGSYALAWRPANRRRDMLGSDETMSDARSAAPAELGEDDGLGESTATGDDSPPFAAEAAAPPHKGKGAARSKATSNGAASDLGEGGGSGVSPAQDGVTPSLGTDPNTRVLEGAEVDRVQIEA